MGTRTNRSKDYESLKSAIKEIKINKRPIAAVATAYNIPKGSLYRYLDKLDKSSTDILKITDEELNSRIRKITSRSAVAYGKAFTEEEEQAFADFILKCTQVYDGMTTDEFSQLAFQYAKKMNVRYPLTWNVNQRAGQTWYYNFTKRHPYVSLRKLEHSSIKKRESTSALRMQAWASLLAEIVPLQRPATKTESNCLRNRNLNAAPISNIAVLEQKGATDKTSNQNSTKNRPTSNLDIMDQIIEQEFHIKEEVTEIVNENEVFADAETKQEFIVSDPINKIPSCSSIKEEVTDIENIIEVDFDTTSTSKNSAPILSINDALQNLTRNQEFIIARLDEINRRQEELAKMIIENNAILTRTSGKRCKQSKFARFPLMTEQDLNEINVLLQGDKKDEIVMIIENILSVGGLQLNINKILDTSLIMEFNYDGSKGKKCLKEFQALIEALFDATFEEGRTMKCFLNELRSALKTHKNRFHKMMWRQKNQTSNEPITEF